MLIGQFQLFLDGAGRLAYQLGKDGAFVGCGVVLMVYVVIFQITSEERTASL